ncbi:hypothetical protein GA0070216_11530 [Micromonospora matsumotoense]|uniref:Uncharacterized protein n=1 Tax=Micromonospora matsumotoense TaxID=121616 RepID=A0A1C5AAD1_9ACTN|nr:hypothetical protein GA0070216_11530 [Micromonospora matsumotoense]
MLGSILNGFPDVSLDLSLVQVADKQATLTGQPGKAGAQAIVSERVMQCPGCFLKSN